MSKTKLLHHIVFATKYRECTLVQSEITDLYRFVAGVIRTRHCFVHKVGGFKNHLHIVVDLHPSIALAQLIRDLKLSTHKWLRQNPKFPNFNQWCSGYYGCSLSPSHLNAAIEYVANQVVHHTSEDFDSEMDRLLERIGLEHHPDDFR